MGTEFYDYYAWVECHRSFVYFEELVGHEGDAYLDLLKIYYLFMICISHDSTRKNKDIRYLGTKQP